MHSSKTSLGWAPLAFVVLVTGCTNGAAAASTTTIEPPATAETTATTTSDAQPPGELVCSPNLPAGYCSNFTTTTAGPTGNQALYDFVVRFGFADTIRAVVVDHLEKTSGVGSVDSVEVVTTPADYSVLIVIDVTSIDNRTGPQADLAWLITRNFEWWWALEIWMGAEGVEGGGPAWPDVLISVSGKAWTCSHDFMQQLATSQATRSDWETACGSR